MPDKIVMPVSVNADCRLKDVCTGALVTRTKTCAGPGAPRTAVAETIPFASDVAAELPSETDCGVSACQVTLMLGIGFPDASSTRAVSGTGNCWPGGPDWLLPSRIRSVAGC